MTRMPHRLVLAAEQWAPLGPKQSGWSAPQPTLVVTNP